MIEPELCEVATRLGLPGRVEDWALFLDVDGTLLDIAARPEAVVVPPELIATLARLSRALDGAVALISGRPLDWIERRFAPLSLPAAGQHGAELRLAPVTAPRPRQSAPELDGLRLALADFAAAHRGVLLEDRGLSLAADCRQRPMSRGALARLIEDRAAALGEDWHVVASRMAFEVKRRRHSRGSAVDWFMRQERFAGRMPIYFGDGAADGDGFTAARRWGGACVSVGSNIAASIAVASPTALRARLAHMAEDAVALSWPALAPLSVAASQGSSASPLPS